MKKAHDIPPMSTEEIASILAKRLLNQGITYYDIHREIIYRDLFRERSKDNPTLRPYSSRKLHEIEDFLLLQKLDEKESLDSMLKKASLQITNEPSFSRRKAHSPFRHDHDAR